MSGLTYYLTPGSPAGNGMSLNGALPSYAVVCTQAQHDNASAWQVVNGEISAYTPPAPSLAQQAAALLTTGLAITSTSTASLDATYAVDPQTVGYKNSELNAILLNGTFADGTTTIEWPDIGGALHAFSIAEFKSLASACGSFVSSVRKCIIGASGATLPSASATIP